MLKHLASAALALLVSGQAHSVERICSTCFPLNDGDFVHRSDVLTPGWIGHSGIKLTPKNSTQSAIYDVNTGRPPGQALRALTFAQWQEGQPYWGAKRSSRLDARRVAMMSADLQRILDMRTEYDGNHVNQKGEVLKDSSGRIYFEADCVGLVEGLHEGTRDDLTPNADEGPILFVQTQRDRSFSFDVGK